MLKVHPKPVPFDPELAAILDTIPFSATFTPDMIGDVRAQSDASTPTIEELVAGRPIEWKETTISGADGKPMQATIFRPAGLQGTAPCIVHTHGGGMIAGDRFTSANVYLEWVLEQQCVLVTFEYRLAPENPHPALVEDCYAALCWTAENAVALGVDPDRILIAGVSAGGGLAAAVALLARDRNGPPLLAQILVCPMLDDRNETVSANQFDGIGIWDGTSNRTGWGALLGDARGTPDVSPYAAPARSTDLSGLPPAFIDVGSAEVFRDEAVAYAMGIWVAGGDAELHVWQGGFHGFDGIAFAARLSREARETRIGWLSRTLANVAPRGEQSEDRMTDTYPAVPFDRELEAALAQFPFQPTITEDMIGEIRRQSDELTPPIGTLIGDRPIDMEECEIPGADGNAMRATIFRPRGAASPLPGIVHTHGGGMIAGDRFTSAPLYLEWVLELGCVLVTFDYRLAPEHPHPAPVEDCYAGLLWTAANVGALGIDPDRLAVGGVSAGGGLAAAVGLIARDRGGPKLAAQILVCPMIDDRNNTVSARQIDGIGTWDRTSNQTGWRALLGSAQGSPGVSPYAAPARAENLAGLPPTLIDVGSAEVFRDECVNYASRIWAAGGTAELHVWPGGFHGFDGWIWDAALSVQARASRNDWIRRNLGRE